MRSLIITVLAFSFCGELRGQNAYDPLLSIAETELKREMEGFSKTTNPPYFISYRINDIHVGRVSSSFGSLVLSYTDHDRRLVTEVKVGDYSFDNTHPVNSFEGLDFPDLGRSLFSFELPLEDRPEAIRMVLWQQTQGAYRSALSRYKTLKNSPASALGEAIDDFTKETPVVHMDGKLPEFTTLFDKTLWDEKIKKFSSPFLVNPDIVDADATLEVAAERKYFVSSEGTRIAENRVYAYLNIRASILATDGDIVPLHLSYFAQHPLDLPQDDVVLRDIDIMIEKLGKLRKAPLAEPYTGPAILHSRAAGVFFHEIFGHRVEGHRLKNIRDGQTFKGKLGEQVLPKTLNVVFDPTLKVHEGQPLNGHYLYDDEGVKGQRVKVVEDGILKTFLMSRNPIENKRKSNGHGRAQAGAKTVTRQSNLLIENRKEVSMAELRKMLIAECRKQRKDYGYLFMDVVGGFTMTGRFIPNAFNIFPTEVYRVYVDGREDELVRGVDLIGTPLAMFAEITAADDKSDVFTGFCGAESGNVPVTAISPSLFVKRIETQKKVTTQVEKTLLVRPTSDSTKLINH